MIKVTEAMKSSLCAGLEVLRLRGRSSTRGSLARDNFPRAMAWWNHFVSRTRDGVQCRTEAILGHLVPTPGTKMYGILHNVLIHPEIGQLRLLQPVSRSKKAIVLN